jgi:hypothetical protein
VNESLNPYESPVIPADETLQEDAHGLTARFTMDEADLLTSATQVSVAPAAWVLWVAVPFLLFGVASVYYFPNQGIKIVGSLLLLWSLIVVGSQLPRNRRLWRRTLQELRSHPVLGSLGPWKLAVGRDRYLVETLGGKRVFMRSETKFAMSTKHPVIWLDALPIAIPNRGPYWQMWLALRQRLWDLSQNDK